MIAEEQEEERKEQELQKQKREEQAKANKLIEDKMKEPSLLLAARLKEMSITTKVKVDKQGHMFGSVTDKDIVKLMEEQGVL